MRIPYELVQPVFPLTGNFPLKLRHCGAVLLPTPGCLNSLVAVRCAFASKPFRGRFDFLLSLLEKVGFGFLRPVGEGDGILTPQIDTDASRSGFPLRFALNGDGCVPFPVTEKYRASGGSSPRPRLPAHFESSEVGDFEMSVFPVCLSLPSSLVGIRPT